MAFAPGGYAEEVTECIVRHVFPRWRQGRSPPAAPLLQEGATLIGQKTAEAKAFLCVKPAAAEMLFPDFAMAVTKPAAAAMRRHG
ncbi:hypothetical protein RHECNPAF_2760023 [Rhizobium etli CNPAF512]|nr:hypothetical protein RHECNPAF_2760023 [Rhizobium etli CNPAF512]